MNKLFKEFESKLKPITLITGYPENIEKFLNGRYVFNFDQIANLHITRIKSKWIEIFQHIGEFSAPYFVTTQFKECVAAFNELNINNEGVHMEIYVNSKNDELCAKFRDHEQLEYVLTHDLNFRGEI